jgi:hypothetical protein
MIAYVDELRTRPTAETSQSRGSSWNLSSAVSPLDLYCYLKVRFGEPNGFMMVLKSPTVDNFCHWHYTLESPESIVELLGLDTRTEIRLFHVPGVSPASWEALERELVADFDRRREPMQKVRRSFERWHLFINPYRRLAAIVERYMARLQEIDIGSVSVPVMPKIASDFPRHAEEVKRAQELYREAMALSTSIQLIAPVMAEAAINMVMLLLARPEVRADRRLYEDFARRNVDVRIKSLHLCCLGFAQPVTGSEEPFKNVLRVMNRRNDALHGAVDPTVSTGGEIFFDHGNIPLVARHQTLAETALAHALANAKPPESLRDVEIVRAFVDFLITRLESELQPLIREALEREQLGYRPEAGRIGVILPAARVDLIAGEVTRMSEDHVSE